MTINEAMHVRDRAYDKAALHKTADFSIQPPTNDDVVRYAAHRRVTFDHDGLSLLIQQRFAKPGASDKGARTLIA